MTDSEFILWYIEKHYLFTGSKFKTKYINEEPITYIQLINNIINSLAIEKIDNKSLYDFLYNWYLDKQNESKLDILDFIKFKYKVTLGYRSWQLSQMNGKPTTIDKIILDFKGKYDKDFISNIINNWYENQVIEYSEKIILDFK